MACLCALNRLSAASLYLSVYPMNSSSDSSAASTAGFSSCAAPEEALAARAAY